MDPQAFELALYRLKQLSERHDADELFLSVYSDMVNEVHADAKAGALDQVECLRRSNALRFLMFRQMAFMARCAMQAGITEAGVADSIGWVQ